jgi:hypothetical protein
VRKVDYSLLTKPKVNVRHKQTQVQVELNDSGGNTKAIYIMAAVFAGLVMITAVQIIVRLLREGSIDLISFFEVIMMLYVIAFIVAIPKLIKRFGLYLRLPSFTEANGWLYRRKAYPDGYNGQIFRYGERRSLSNVIEVPADNLFEGQNHFDFGNYSFKRGDSVYEYGFVRIKLSRHLPHVFLDSKSKNLLPRLSNLPAEYRRSQLVELSIGFDKYFNTYVPEGYERDALEILTIDLLGDLVNYAANYDFEIIDDELYIFSSPKFDLTNPEQYEKIFQIVQIIAEKLDHKASRYVDHRMVGEESGGIASAGRRLK